MTPVRDPAVDSVLEKWRARWPEWTFAEPFIPFMHRERALAWFALRSELVNAAWGGSDPRPGEAKLAWWAEELQGWTRGMRRHPLGNVLQREPAPWGALAMSIPSLMASRARATDADDAFARLVPHAEALSLVSTHLFASPSDAAPVPSVVAGLLTEHLFLMDADAVPNALASAPDAPRAWARELWNRWPVPHEGAVAGRLYATLLRKRLLGFAKGAGPATPLAAWRALGASWRAARR
jgi:hypothetical protein